MFTIEQWSIVLHSIRTVEMLLLFMYVLHILFVYRTFRVAFSPTFGIYPSHCRKDILKVSLDGFDLTSETSYQPNIFFRHSFYMSTTCVHVSTIKLSSRVLHHVMCHVHSNQHLYGSIVDKQKPSTYDGVH